MRGATTRVPGTAPAGKSAPVVNEFHFDFTGAIITGGKKEIEDMVVKAASEAARKGRLRSVGISKV
jgi:hypothetical protein